MQTQSSSALNTLLNRRSSWPLTTPGPNADELASIVQTAASAPDHAGLQPWHFEIVEGESRHELLRQVLAHPDAQNETVQSLHTKFTLKLTTAPTVIVLAAHITPSNKAPEFEQLLSVGAAAMNMLNAAWALGYSGFWSSTPSPLNGLLHSVMDFSPEDRLVGLLNLGTPTREAKSTQERPDWHTYSQIWSPK